MTTSAICDPTPILCVEYKYSACVKIVGTNSSILCDPWFSDTAYYGAWSRYPSHQITKEFLGYFDYIWISHIHPDHYCPHTLGQIFSIYGNKRILICDWGEQKNYLEQKLASDGFSDVVKVVSELTIGNLTLRCLPNKTGSASDIDSCLIVHDANTGKCLVNLNDCIVTPHFAAAITKYIEAHHLTTELLCLSYTGAGPYPQTYYSPLSDKDKLKDLADAKKSKFLDRYKSTISLIPSKYRLPFAGKYLLSGELSFMNDYRGVADALEVKDIDPHALVLDDSGSSYFDLITGHTGKQRLSLYQYESVEFGSQLLWKKWINFEPDTILLLRLLRTAYNRAMLKSECDTDYIWNFYLYDSAHALVDIAERPFDHSHFLLGFNCNRQCGPSFFTAPRIDSAPCSCLFIDRRALFAALTGVCHWNNLEIGSSFFVRRNPDDFVREAYNFLNFLSVI